MMTLKQAKRLLSKPEWIDGLETMKVYRRKEDDSPDGFLSVTIGNDGDAWISVHPDERDGISTSLRFRVPFIGGGASPRVRKALLLLAAAIKLDNEGNDFRAM
jgi:hypothetical protein